MLGPRTMRRLPNILLILADDHGYGDASCYGGAQIQTPAIDRLAAEGARCTGFYANSSVCSPSRAALMTGCYPDRVGVPGVIRTHPERSWGYFSQTAVTLPQMLDRAGYHSSLIGKWHLGLEAENHPRSRGFHHFHGFLGDMMDDYLTHRRHGHNYMRHERAVIDPAGHATDLFTQWAVRFIQERADEEAPFFLYLAYNAPHTPIQPPEDWVARVQARHPELPADRVRYLALVEHLDAGVGRVLAELDSSGQAQDTLVIYTSDNGGQLDVGASNGDLRGAKGQMYEGGIRVPACIRWPEHIRAGSEVGTVAMLSDLLPTLCEAAEVDVDHPIDGVSILPTLHGTPQDFSDRTYYWVRREGYPAFQGLAQHAVRQGDLKLLHDTPFSPLELYDLREDPREERDLSAEQAEAFNSLGLRLRHEVQRAGGVPWQKP